LSTTYKLEVWGAQGGWQDNGAKGGYAMGKKSLTASGNIYICIGSQGGVPNGSTGGTAGYNGGGKGGNGFNYAGGGGGGGATHIANVSGVLSSLSSNRTSVFIVAGGGGGTSHGCVGGSGGGINGGDAKADANTETLKGATQTTGYAFGQGEDGFTKTYHGNGGAEGNGGGGGGWYGGFTLHKQGNQSDCGGSGGSGYVNTSQLTNTSMQSGVRSGNGYALITWMPVL